MTTYSEKLRDPRWQRRRLEILDRAEFACEECGVEGERLQVHHKAYRSGVEPWEYEDSELIALCGGCHSDRHEVDQILRKIIGHAEMDFVARNHLALMVLGFCAASSEAFKQYCGEEARKISEHGEDSAWFICGFTAAKGSPQMREPLCPFPWIFDKLLTR